MHSTTSQVLMTGSYAEPEHELLRKWADYAASNGGSFSIEHKWFSSQWYTFYTINWPSRATEIAARAEVKS